VESGGVKLHVLIFLPNQIVRDIWVDSNIAISMDIVYFFSIKYKTLEVELLNLVIPLIIK
jgi:hypothetical protein